MTEKRSITAAGSATAGSPGAGRRWRLRNWRLRTKLVAVLLVPGVLALVFAGLQVASETAKATDLAKLSTQVTLQGKVNKLVHQLQRERDLSVLFVASGHSTNLANLKDVRRRVDDASATFQRGLNDERDDMEQAAADRFDTAASQLDQLPYLRRAVQNSKYPADVTEQAYTRFLEPFLDIGDQAVADINSPELVRLHLAGNAIAQTKESGSQRRALLLDVFQIKKFSAPMRREVQTAEAERKASLSDFQKFATEEQQGWYDDTVTGPLVDAANSITESAISHGLLDEPVDIGVQRWDNAVTVSIDLTDQVQQALHSKLVDRANQLAAAAKRSAVIDGGIVLAVLLFAALFALFVARSLLRPLRTLRRDALAVAEYRLPDEVEQILADSEPEEAARKAVQPVPVHTREEVGQVARAFDAVHGEAVRLASEQALLRDSVNSMFVNLSRRSQALVERQLSVIDRLEADEQDPDQLGSLFELDHLATRMRRNSENLLVLSGTEFGRRMSRPVPVAEVLGAAVSEVEQYARVELSPSPELTVVGRAVNDIVHLVAELLDNATVYSDPQTKVGVRSVRNRAGAWAIEISDRGVGMSEADLASANDRLAEPPDVDVSVSRRMGLYVVARLSKQHDISVSLRENEEAGGGVVARVLVPPDLVRGEGDQPQGSSVDVLGGRGVVLSQPAIEAPGMQDTPEPAADVAAPAMTSAGIEGAFGIPAVGRDETPDTRPEQQERADAPRQPAAPAASRQPPATDDPQAAGPGQQPAPLPKREASMARGRRERINQRVRGKAPAESTREPQARPEAEPVDVAPPVAARPPDHGTPAPVGAPAEPSTPDAGGDSDAGAGERQVERADLDGPTERLPIYEQVLSQWFTDEPQPAVTPQRPRERQQAEAAGAGLPTREPGVAGQARRETMPSGASSYRPQEGSTPHGRQQAPESPAGEQRNGHEPDGWATPADEGWQAVQALDQPAEQTTKAGLPKRKPRAQLVPGSAPQRATPPAAAPAGATQQVTVPPRSPDAVRGRMSSLQQGVRRGRHALTETYPGGRSNESSSDGREQ